MANFKRKRAKNARNFCHMCKYYKLNGAKQKGRPTKEFEKRKRMEKDAKEQQDG